VNLLPFFIVWTVLAVVVVALLFYRRVISGEEDDILHIEDSTGSLTSRQTVVAKKLEVVDRWGKILTVIVVLYGLALLAGYLYMGWVQSGQYRG
jgi:hypothetical protein